MAELLSQAIGEFDTSAIALWAVVSLTAVVARLLLGAAATEWLRRLLNPSRKADAGGSGLARRQPLRSHRQPGNRPARPFQGSTPEKLARSMRCSGRVPVSHYRHQRWLVAFWRAMKLYLLPVKTLPKSAFTAVDWRYEPSALTGLAAGHPFCGGLELRVRLHRHENRHHLRRSLQVGGLRARSRRLVVIASARDIFDPGSWVRCLVVDADTLYLPKQSRGWVAVRGADPSSVDAPVVHRRQHKDVPDGAVWLIVPTSAYCPPAAAWGQAAERLNQQTRATIEAAPQDCRDLDDEDYVRHWVKWNRKVTLAIWAVLGPGTFVMAVLAPSLALAFLERLPAAFETFVEVGIVTWVWYSSAYAVTRLAASRTASRQPQRTAAYPGRPRAHAANATPPQTRLASAARSPRTGQSLRRHGRSGAGTEQPHTSQNTGAEEASRRRRRVTRHCDRRVRSPRGAL